MPTYDRATGTAYCPRCGPAQLRAAGLQQDIAALQSWLTEHMLHVAPGVDAALALGRMRDEQYRAWAPTDRPRLTVVRGEA